MSRSRRTARAASSARLAESTLPGPAAGKPDPRRQAELLRSMADSAAEGAIAASTDGQLTLYNASARRMLGRVFRGIPPQDWPRTVGLYREDGKTLWPAPDLPLVRAMKGEAVDNVRMIVRNRLRPKGLLIRVHARPVRDRRGKLLGGIVTFRDITAEQRVASELLESRERLRSLAARIESAREEERTRISREIHDDLGQTLTAIKFDAALLARKLRDGKPYEAAEPHIQSILRLADSGMQSVQSICMELRPPVLEELGLISAIEWQAEDFQTRTGIRCGVTCRPGRLRFSRELSTAVFRTVQEALTNVARHSGASRVRISIIEAGGELRLRISDNGRGVMAREIASSGGLGLLGMRERAAVVGGQVVIRGTVGKGTTVVLRVPATRAPAGREAAPRTDDAQDPARR